MDNPKTNIGFVGAWFAASTVALIFSLAFAWYSSNTRLVKPAVQNYRLYTAIPKSTISIVGEVDF